jgi:biotin carboxyl carrier protein
MQKYTLFGFIQTFKPNQVKFKIYLKSHPTFEPKHTHMEYQVRIGEHQIEIAKNNNEWLINGAKSTYTMEKSGNRYLLYGEKKITEVIVLNQQADRLRLLVNGKETEVLVKDHIALMLDKLGMSATEEKIANEVYAPMPGVILQVLVSAGQEVKKGDPLLILEAMKMENLIKAPADVTIESVSVTKGQSVEKNALLMRFS